MLVWRSPRKLSQFDLNDAVPEDHLVPEREISRSRPMLNADQSYPSRELSPNFGDGLVDVKLARGSRPCQGPGPASTTLSAVRRASITPVLREK